MMISASWRLRGTGAAVLVFLLIEFVDEFVFGVREAAWPLLRDEFGLSYLQIGLLIGLPVIIAFFIELPLGLLADLGHRTRIVLTGGLAFVLSLMLTGAAADFSVLLVSYVLFYPASGAFVSLSQASLMDVDPSRHEQNMARWTFAGSVGVVVGALAVGVLPLADASWRVLFWIGAGLSLCALWMTARMKLHARPSDDSDETPEGFAAAVRAALAAARDWRVLRWCILLLFSDLVLDKLLAYMALYFVDVVGVGEAEASIGVAVFVVLGLLGDVLVIPLLERIRGLTYLKITAAVMLVLFPAFLLAPGFAPKVILAGVIGLLNSGWYSVLQGKLYSAMPGRSGTVTTVGNLIGVLDSLFPLVIGFVAQTQGLETAMWLLWLGPITVLAGLPRREAA
jgi:FSR family fosmidomycin resistance protein-like MFS transporter